MALGRRLSCQRVSGAVGGESWGTEQSANGLTQQKS